ncbi:hypothetical protein DPM19_27765 [Actinomadura craniellae]|uniref:Uncharacterized protein n=1 Tax=Actinomadura craniellae TaxID=2231787 RepID=A0A365GY67_9ACTN|nr:hypothetical protein [Actinomadura craniellae]RAY11785.1 hypothetical protein DPM19_27765 [Actinomadura craniellae]
MKPPAADLHARLHARVCSALLAAMRADVTAIDTVAGLATDLDPHTAGFLRESRRLVLACAAAVSSVLDVHRPTTAPDAPRVCRECGTGGCRTLNAVLTVLDAYAAGPAGIDRAEAWRRADRFFNGRGGPPLPVAVEDIGDGFAARAFTPSEPTGPLLVVDRRTGRLTRWPPMPRETLIAHYRHHRTGLP